MYSKALGKLWIKKGTAICRGWNFVRFVSFSREPHEAASFSVILRAQSDRALYPGDSLIGCKLGTQTRVRRPGTLPDSKLLSVGMHGVLFETVGCCNP